jgi:hypothetical protein
MNHRSLAAAALVFALAACGAESKPPAAAPPPVADSSGVSRDMLIGRWGDNGDCRKDIAFAADGTFRSHTGGVGTWTLDGDRMTMSGVGGAFTVGVELLNANTLIIHNGDGSMGTSQRC